MNRICFSMNHNLLSVTFVQNKKGGILIKKPPFLSCIFFLYFSKMCLVPSCASGYLSWYPVLLSLTVYTFIKLSDGSLQCKFIQTFLKMFKDIKTDKNGSL